MRRLVVVALLAGCTSAPRPAQVPCEELGRRYTPDEIRADVDWLFARIEDAHPDPYSVTSREEMARHRAAFLASLPRPVPRAHFLPALERLVARLGDGHTGVGAGEETSCYVASGGRLFPLRVTWDGERVRVRETPPEWRHLLAREPAPGTELLAINGHPVRWLFERLTEQRSGELPAWRRALVEGLLSQALYQNGVLAPFRIQYRTPDGAVAVRVLEGARLDRGPPRAPRGPATYRLLRSRIAYIDFRDMNRDLRGELARFLEQTFAELRRAGARGVVVDLRSNGGGSEELGAQLLDYVTDRPYRFHGGVVRKTSRTWRDALRAQAPWWVPVGLAVRLLAPDELVEAWRAPDGRISSSTDDALLRPGRNPLRYRGPVAFLIGPRTFSSAGGLAGAIAEYRLATLIGETTGQPTAAFGDLIPLQLPRTRIHATISTARFLRANGDARPLPVAPHIEVRQPPGHAGDAVLERAERWILERRGAIPADLDDRAVTAAGDPRPRP